MAEQTYTGEEVAALLARAREAAQQEIAMVRAAAAAAVSAAKEVAQRQIAEMMERRAQSYREGIAGEGPVCGAVAPHTGAECQREPGHPLGPLDRHKAVFGEPHEAVVWND